MITDKERLELIAETRRNAKQANFCADLCFRLAADAERDARAKEQRGLRDLARRFLLKHGRSMPAPLPAGHTAQVFQLNSYRRNQYAR
jgi:hypothetical protein